MPGGGSTIAMIRSIESNAKLLNRTNMFKQIRSVNHTENQKYNHVPMSSEALTLLRERETKERMKNQLNRRIISLIVLLPLLFVLAFGIYLLIHALG